MNLLELVRKSFCPSALHICTMHTVHVHAKRDLSKLQAHNCLPLKTRNSQNTKPKPDQSEVCKGSILALLSQMSLCELFLWFPTTFKTRNPTVIIQGVQFHQWGGEPGSSKPSPGSEGEHSSATAPARLLSSQRGLLCSSHRHSQT